MATSFEKTLGQWIDPQSPPEPAVAQCLPRRDCGQDASGKRTYWAMVIAGDYEPKPGARRAGSPLLPKQAFSFPRTAQTSGCPSRCSAFAFEAAQRPL